MVGISASSGPFHLRISVEKSWRLKGELVFNVMIPRDRGFCSLRLSTPAVVYTFFSSSSLFNLLDASRPDIFLLLFLKTTPKTITMRCILSLLSSVALVAAHGYVESATIGGKEYEFYNPNVDPYSNPIPERISRPIPGNGPVEDISSIDLQCNGYTAGGVKGSQPAALHAEAEAGSTVNLRWTLWPDSHVGPVLTYMARCPDEGCDAWEPASEKVWFKVQEAGREGTSNNWAAVSFTSLKGSKLRN